MSVLDDTPAIDPSANLNGRRLLWDNETVVCLTARNDRTKLRHPIKSNWLLNAAAPDAFGRNLPIFPPNASTAPSVWNQMRVCGVSSLPWRQSAPQPVKETAMNWDQIQGKWKQYKGQAKEAWGDLTDDEFDRMGGKRDQMVGLVQEKYGKAKSDAEHEVDAWFAKL